MNLPARHVTTTRSGRIEWIEAGSGEALVLLHGIGSAARSWSAQLAGPLARSRRLIAWNAPGYGQSLPLPADAPRAADYAAALADLLDALGIAGCDLLGHSLGALIATSFAAGSPQRVASLTLASCAVGHARLDADERARLLESRIADVRDLGARGMAEKRGPRLVTPDAPEAIRAAVIDTMGSVEPMGYEQAARMLSAGDLFADLARLPPGLPVEVICGAEDVITPPAINERVAAARPGTPFTLVPQAGHAVYLEQPARFDSIVGGFIGAEHGV
jgi:pimeloyl-ACP methyl ester carboxylesterase